MKMKKLFMFALALALCICAFGTQVFADEESAAVSSVAVYITISDGSLVLAEEPVTVTDIDGDGALTINDALYLAHEAKYDGGAAAGYASAKGDYGLAMNKLWGIGNGGSYGYYVNNAAAMNLDAAVNDGDYIYAFAYTDTTAFSDTYSFFDVNTVSAEEGAEFTLTLSAAGYDASWNPVVNPVEGATIFIDGVATEFKTDAEGKVSITVDSAKTCVISASSESMTLVPPVCVAVISAASEISETASSDESVVSEVSAAPQTGDSAGTVIYIALGAISFAAIVALVIRRRQTYEK